MKRLMNMLSAVIVILFTGCSTGILFSEFAPNIPNISPVSGRIYVYHCVDLSREGLDSNDCRFDWDKVSWANKKPGQPGTISGALGGRPHINLNGEIIGEAISMGLTYVDRPPGGYEISIDGDKRKLQFVLEKGQTRYVRINMYFWENRISSIPILVANEIAQKEIQMCRIKGK
jgi:hypothetical protein